VARVAASATLARGARLAATRIPDAALAAVREEQSILKLQRRINRWRRIRRVW